jgi:hypothetical protein
MPRRTSYMTPLTANAIGCANTDNVGDRLLNSRGYSERRALSGSVPSNSNSCSAVKSPVRARSRFAQLLVGTHSDAQSHGRQNPEAKRARTGCMRGLGFTASVFRGSMPRSS